MGNTVRKLSIVGKRLPLKDAYEKVTGQLRYPVDFGMPGMLCAKILRSPYPHARIVNIDTSKAEDLSGVEAVLTHKDVPQEEFAEAGSSFRGRVLDSRVRFVGDEVAAVAAKDKWTAEEALRLIQVEYEELPHVFDIEDAMKPDAPLVQLDGNVRKPVVFEWGDIDRGFAEADVVVEHKTTTGTQQHGIMGRNAYVANWEGSKVTLWSFTHQPSEMRDDIARFLKMPENKVRLIDLPSGASFGAWRLNRLPLITIFLAKKAGKPVKLEPTQEECFADVVRRENAVSWGKLGLKKDGTFVAIHARHCFGNGSYCVKSHPNQNCSDLWARAPHGKFEMIGVSTNLVRGAAMRGVGNVTMNFFMEQLIDKAAETLGLDPVDIRLKNHIRAGEVIHAMQPFYKAYGIPYQTEVLSTCGLKECITKGAEVTKWKQRWKGWGQPIEVNGPRRCGIGMAVSAHVSGVRALGTPSAIVKISRDGSVNLLSGIACMGQGNDTTQAQIVAEELGVPFDSVSVTYGDTDVCPWSPITAASSNGPQIGLATQAAAADAKRQLLELASVRLKARPEDLEIKSGVVFVKGQIENGIPVSEVISRGQGMGDAPNIIIGSASKNISEYPTPLYFMAHFVEVEVDTETGKVEILRHVVYQDSGTIINPEVMENQIAGGVRLGCGFGLCEDLIFDGKTGRVLNPNFMFYKALSSVDLPDPEIGFIEVYEPLGPFGVKGGAEGPSNCPAPAIAQAIHNAIGVMLNPPFTPDNVLKALKDRAMKPK